MVAINPKSIIIPPTEFQLKRVLFTGHKVRLCSVDKGRFGMLLKIQVQKTLTTQFLKSSVNSLPSCKLIVSGK